VQTSIITSARKYYNDNASIIINDIPLIQVLQVAQL